ncbi:MAG TPA: SpoIIE family protein phosphatase [Coriobacteriia bacterium]|nr:SpoIIE family protein phosphatase [Coriobacteriia bacterium]
MSPDLDTRRVSSTYRRPFASSRWTGYAWIPLALYAAAIIVMYSMGLHQVYDAEWLLPILNGVIFVGAAVISATLAAIGFIESGSPTLLLLGSGVLTFGIASVGGSLLISMGLTNAGVTAHNIGSLLAAGVYGFSASLVWRSPSVDVRRGAILAAAYASVVGVMALVIVAAMDGGLPVFLDAAGSTPIRNATLLLTIMIFLVTSSLFGVQAMRTGTGFVWWYAFGLGLITIGMAGVALGIPGTAVSWAGRLAQATGQLYILACLVGAVLEMPSGSPRSGRMIGHSFKRVEEALRESESRYRKLFLGLNDAYALHRIVLNADGEPVDAVFLDVNEPFERMFGVRAVDIVGRRATRSLPKGAGMQMEWMARFNDVALSGKPQRFESYNEALGLWLSISAYSPEPMQFVSIFHDISPRKREEERREEYVTSLVRLLDVSSEVLSSTDVDEMLQRVADTTRELLGAEVVVAGYEHHDATFRSKATAGASVDGVDAQSIADAISEPEVFTRLVAAPFVMLSEEGVAGARMTGREGQPIGVVAVTGWQEGYTQSEQLLLRQLASIGSLGIQQLKAFEREHLIADTLQEAILATPEPVEELRVGYLYRPASAAANVGGDFYDVFRMDGGRVGLLIGDVSGKGLEAARLTSLVKDSLRSFAAIWNDPRAVIAHVNQLIYTMTPTEAYATVFFAVLEPQRGKAVYCNGGHTPGILQHADGSSRLLDSTGGLVGGMQTMSYENGTFDFAPDDRLILYTDGIVEARVDGALFGVDRLREVVGALQSRAVDDVPHCVLESVLSYTGGVLRDDVVVLCIEPAS